jgi:TatD DNase family protein
MLQLAVTHNLPVSFHIREAFPDFFAVINNFSKVRGVVHSFTDNKKVLKRILNETNFYVGVNGLATYSTLPTPPLDRILLETDAPFLAPLPHRKKTNEPSYILEIANWLSAKLEKDLKTIKKETTRNAKALFNI